MTKAGVINEAKFVAAGNWTAQPDESSATKESVNITKIWQERLIKIDPERFKKEVKIAEKMNEKSTWSIFKTRLHLN